MRAKKNKVGRPKIAESEKKVGFSIKVKPILMDAINEKTAGKNRNLEIETILEKKYL